MKAALTGIRVLFALAFVAVAIVAMSPIEAGAEQKTKSQMNHKERADDFADGCKNAGGRPQILESKDPNTTHVRCNMGDYAVSCVYHQGYSEVTEVCAGSRGIKVSPQRPFDTGLLTAPATLDSTITKGGKEGTPGRVQAGGLVPASDGNQR